MNALYCTFCAAHPSPMSPGTGRRRWALLIQTMSACCALSENSEWQITIQYPFTSMFYDSVAVKIVTLLEFTNQ